MEWRNCRGISLIVVVVLFALLALGDSSLWARPTTAEEAERLVVGWLRADPEPLGATLGQQVRGVETYANEVGEAIYHIVYLRPSGFVIVSADDLVEPVIGFVQDDSFDPSPDNPLGALVADDLSVRVAAVRNRGTLRIMAEEPFGSRAQAKWRRFMDLADARKRKGAIASMSIGLNAISDVRVAPLMRSKWGQLTISTTDGGLTTGQDCPLPCYNYYTPNNYLCGCPATALAQLMRYHEYPTAGIGVREFQITIAGQAQQASTRGGDGLGGPYDWGLMPYVPSCDTPEVQRQAIGALCYDAGVSMNQNYGRSASGWGGCSNARMTNALQSTFMYANAVHGYTAESPIGQGVIGMINPNLDAQKPVILGTVKHAFVCDGYGYIDSTLYHHLNMGWLGIDDLWYDLRTSIISPIDGFNTGIVCSCVYNVQTRRGGNGEIISGRVFDHNAEPIAGAVVYAASASEIIATTETDDIGIYAFDCLDSNTNYAITAMLEGYGFSSQEVATGVSRDNAVMAGNCWGVDLVGLLCDFNSNQKVDTEDMAMLIEHWGHDEPDFDVAPASSGNGIVDVEDLRVLLQYWGVEVDVPEFGLVAHWKFDEAVGRLASDSAADNDALAIGDPVWQPSGGRLGGALEFDGVDDWVKTDLALNPANGAFSVFAWVKGGAPGQVIISQQGGSDWLMLDPVTGVLMTELKSGGRSGAVLYSDAIITDGTWHRVGFTWDGSTRSLYVDDGLVAEDAQGELASCSGGLNIGTGHNAAPGTYWTGLIDDVRIYHRAVNP